PLTSSHQIWSPVTGSYAARSPPPSPTRSACGPNAGCTVSTPEHERCDQSGVPSLARNAKIIPIGCDVHNALAHNRRRRERRSDLASPLKGQPGNIGASEDSLVAIEARVGGQESVLRPFN